MSIWKKMRFKPEEPKVDPVDLSLVGVDMHSHLIPGIDDGAQNMEESIGLIRTLHELGYTKLITTPHVYHDLYPNKSETILSGLAKVRETLKQEGIPVELEAAAEYYLDEQFERMIEEKTLLTFGQNHILFEISFADEPMNFKRALFNLKLQGYKPILAHPERYEYWNSNFKKYEDLHEQDIFLQLNINCLTGHYGAMVKKISERMIDAGIVSFIGTDCHHTGHIELLQAARTNAKLKQLIESGALKNGTLLSNG